MFNITTSSQRVLFLKVDKFILHLHEWTLIACPRNFELSPLRVKATTRCHADGPYTSRKIPRRRVYIYCCIVSRRRRFQTFRPTFKRFESRLSYRRRTLCCLVMWRRVSPSVCACTNKWPYINSFYRVLKFSAPEFNYTDSSRHFKVITLNLLERELAIYGRRRRRTIRMHATMLARCARYTPKCLCMFSGVVLAS